MELKIYNNLTRKKEQFTPITPGKVRFYSCGPTTYDFLHVGNARALVTADLFHRIFRALGHEVVFVRNFTDVDDKIIERANELGVSPLAHSDRFVRECQEDMDSLGMDHASFTPKVSETMPEIISMIETLIQKGAAYEVDGEVFYSVESFQGYGKLSKKKLEDLEHGIRVEVDKRKKHPSDFVLWKPAKPSEPAWESPWGKGRPGWHIECSAMAKKFLGNSIDIHHGGVDLIFPHHENEIAQSEKANDAPFSSFWCHNEFLNFGSEKMSKSLGNVITIRKFVETYGGQVLRQVLLSVHYRSKMEWGTGPIERAISDLERIHEFIKEFKSATQELNTPGKDPEGAQKIASVIDQMKEELANDFNVPGALSHFFVLIRDVRRDYLQKKNLPSDVAHSIDLVLGFVEKAIGCVHLPVEKTLEVCQKARKALLGGAEDSGELLSDQEVNNLVQERVEAKKSKNWARADEIRKLLDVKGVKLQDNPDGTTSWKYQS